MIFYLKAMWLQIAQVKNTVLDNWMITEICYHVLLCLAYLYDAVDIKKHFLR